MNFAKFTPGLPAVTQAVYFSAYMPPEKTTKQKILGAYYSQSVSERDKN